MMSMGHVLDHVLDHIIIDLVTTALQVAGAKNGQKVRVLDRVPCIC